MATSGPRRASLRRYMHISREAFAMANDGLVPLRKDIFEILVLVIMVSEREPQINASCLSQRLATTKCDNLERLKAMHSQHGVVGQRLFATIFHTAHQNSRLMFSSLHSQTCSAAACASACRCECERIQDREKGTTSAVKCKNAKKKQQENLR